MTTALLTHPTASPLSLFTQPHGTQCCSLAEGLRIGRWRTGGRLINDNRARDLPADTRSIAGRSFSTLLATSASAATAGAGRGPSAENFIGTGIAESRHAPRARPMNRCVLRFPKSTCL